MVWRARKPPNRPFPHPPNPVQNPRGGGASAPAPQNGAPIDLEAYLTKKGHKVMRLSSTLFSIDGKRTSLEQALRTANAHRRTSELPDITEADLA